MPVFFTGFAVAGGFVCDGWGSFFAADAFDGALFDGAFRPVLLAGAAFPAVAAPTLGLAGLPGAAPPDGGFLATGPALALFDTDVAACTTALARAGVFNDLVRLPDGWFAFAIPESIL